MTRHAKISQTYNKKKISVKALGKACIPEICLYTHKHFAQICGMQDLNESTGFFSGNADKQNNHIKLCMRH